MNVAFDPVSDSGISVSYQEANDSRSSSCSGDVYVTTGLGQHIVVSIGANQSCKFGERK